MEGRSGCWKREEKFPMAVGVGRLTKNCKVYQGKRQPHHLWSSRALPRDQGLFQPLNTVITL